MVSRSQIQRQTMIFFLPLNMEAFTSEQNPYSASKAGDNLYAKRQLYINPNQFSINERKLINSTLTKGGYSVQYWGEELATISARGTTGSAGIEGINILRDIYRHEQNQYRVVLAERQRRLAEAALKAKSESLSTISNDPLQTFTNVANIVTGGAFTLGDAATGGAFTNTTRGLQNAIDVIADPFQERQDLTKSSFVTIPTLAAFATNIDLYYQGEFFKGYFTAFNVSESGEQPGIINYDLSFTVTKRTGKRSNFMPWNRNPLDADGQTVMSQKVTDSKGTDGSYNLSFPVRDGVQAGNFSKNLPLDQLNDRGVPGIDLSAFKDEAVLTQPQNSVPISRKGFINKGNS